MGRDRDTVRVALLAKLEATWPRYRDSPELRRRVEAASNAELRKHLAWAELMSETALEPDADTLSPRFSEHERKSFGRIRHAHWSSVASAYALARDVCSWYAGPDWTPFNLWQTAEYGSGLVASCAKVLSSEAGAETLWASIAAKYPRPDAVALTLPMVCAEAKARWRDIPRMTPSKFRANRERLAKHAEQLALELERFYLPRDPDDCEFAGLWDFAELLTQEELDKLDASIRHTTANIANRALERVGHHHMDWDRYNGTGDESQGSGLNGDLPPARLDARDVYSLLQRDHVAHWQFDYEYVGVPTLPDMLRRIARKFAEDGQDAPLQRPNRPNAERNFFARAVCKYFWQSHACVSPAIVRDIVCMFYPQGIDENEVSQLAARVKAAHPLA